MAQLSPDAFVFGHDILSIEQSLDEIRARVTPIAAQEDVGLDHAWGRV